MPTSTLPDLLWSIAPSTPNAYYVNSVAVSTGGASVVAGTFFKTYTANDADPEKPVSLPPPVSALPPLGATDSSESGTFGTYCYDRSGKLLWKDEFAGWQGIFWVDCASAAPVCAAGGWYSNSPYAGVLRAYNTNTGHRMIDARTGSRVNQVSLSADGSTLVAAAEGLYLYQNKGGLFAQMGAPLLVQTNDSIVTAAVSGDSSLVVCATLKRGVFVFSQKGGRLVQLGNWAWPATKGCCHSVDVSPDGMNFAVGGSGGVYALFDLDSFLLTGKPTLQCTAPNNAVIYSVAISSDGKGIAVVANVTDGANKGQVRCHLDGSSTPTWITPTVNSPNRLVWRSEAGLIAVADGYPDGCPGRFYQIDAKSGAVQWSYTSGNMAWGTGLAGDGGLLAGGSDDAKAYAFA